MHPQEITHLPAVIWLTGLSGSGKTTIAHSLQELFHAVNISPVLLDGDEIRKTLNVQGFDEASRKQHNLQVGQMAADHERQGQIVIAALISPYRDTRDAIQAICHQFIEVYIATPLATCIERDPKGLYKKALAGEINNFTGISAPYEEPQAPACRIETVNISAVGCAQQIMDEYRKRQAALHG